MDAPTARQRPEGFWNAYAALCTHGITEVIAAIGAVSKHLAGIFGQRVGSGFAIVDIGRCDRHFLNQCRIGVGTNMGFEAMNSPLPLMFYPPRIIIVLTGGGNDGRIDQRTGLDRHRL